MTDDKMSLIWNRHEKSYCGHEWLQYIVKRILVPRGYKPSGIINWFKKLIRDKVEFLHERYDHSHQKIVLSFNLYIQNDIVQVCFDRMNICESRYLYRNLINSNGIIEHNEIDDNDRVDVDRGTCDKAKDLIEKYILENPDFLDNAIA